MATPRPVRAMDPYAQVFWEYTQHKEFRLQQCRECHKFRWPPGPSCDNCLSDQYDWALMTGRGKVLSWTTFHRAYFPSTRPPHVDGAGTGRRAAVRIVPSGHRRRATARGHGAHAAMDRRRGSIRAISFARVRARGRVATPHARGAMVLLASQVEERKTDSVANFHRSISSSL